MLQAEREPRPVGAHLVGSVPLSTTDEVFRRASAVLGDHLRRVPDGEVGERAGWLAWQRRLFERHPLLEAEPPLVGDYPPLPRFRLRPGVTTRDLAFERLGYADVARASFDVFARLKAEGTIPSHWRFQVSLPTALASVVAFVARDAQGALEPACQARMLAEVDEIVAAIPGDQLAIQWDLAAEMWLWEGWVPAPFAAVKGGIIDRLVQLSQRIPRRVEIGFHLCYGDYRHRHFREPETVAGAVAIVNRLVAAASRPVDWVHVPVPRSRDLVSYVEPLRDLHVHPRTEIYLGLLHEADDVDEARARIHAAQHVLPGFGVAAECGLGRSDPESVANLLRLHAALADPWQPAREGRTSLPAEACG
jgi:hypothetical protein